MDSRWGIRLAALAAGSFCVAAPSLAVTISLVPVRSSGMYTRTGSNAISLQPGAQQLFLEVYVSDWDPDHNGDPLLKIIAARINPGSFSNPVSSSPFKLAEQPCSTNAECDMFFGGTGSGCRPPSEMPSICVYGGNCCRPVFWDFSHANSLEGAYIHVFLPDDYFLCNLGEVAAGDADQGAPKYFGSMVLDVPADAVGEFTITMRPFLSNGSSTGYSFYQLEFTGQGSGPFEFFDQQQMIPARVSISVKPKQVHSMKNRYLSIVPAQTTESSAYAIELVSLHHPVRPAPSPYPPQDFTPFEGQIRWIGPPAVYPMGGSWPQHVFYAAELQCGPHFADWSEYSLIEVFGSAVIPDSVYRLRRYPASCADPNNPSCGDYLGEMRTSRWGDLVPPFEADLPGSQPNFADISAIVDQHNDAVGAPSKPQSQLHNNTVDPARLIDAVDMSYVVNAFKGQAYPFAGPSECP